MKRQLGLALTFVFWALALVVALGAAWYEVASAKQKALYVQLLSGDQAQLNLAHKLWYNDTAMVGAVLIFTGIAYLMYVKFLQPVPDQERIITGLKGSE